MDPPDLTASERDTLVQTFEAETLENLAAVEDGLVALELDPRDGEVLERVFRAMHSVKGNAGMFGLTAAADLAHAAEELLDRLRTRRLCVDRPIITDLLSAADALRASTRVGPGAVPGDAESLATLLRERVTAGDASASPASVVSAGPHSSTAGSSPTPALRVSAATLDRLLTLTGEIAVGRSRVGQLLLAADTDPAGLTRAREAHADLDRLHAELQELVMQTRLVPLGPLFRRHARTVRDLAASLGKEAQLVLEHDDVEVDLTVLDLIRDPLTHMIRNAVDHGVELPDERTAAGKPASGRITLRASHDAGNVLVEIEDDGAGIDRARVATRAQALGLHSDPEQLSDEELLQLIMEPGFSTAPAVSEISGRGVGMDVVRRNVEQLGGAVRLRSRPGCGTTVTLQMPLTLAIIRGFCVSVGPESYIVPLETVVECIALPDDPHCRSRQGGVLRLRDTALPYLRLGSLLRVPAATPARESVVVLREGSRQVGLVVDALLGECEAVLKPLGRLLQGIPVLLGSTILGSGRPAFILDVPRLLAQALQGSTPPGGPLHAVAVAQVSLGVP